MYQLAAAQQTTTMKLLACFWAFETKKCTLRVNKNEITSENAFNGDFIEIEDKHEQTKKLVFSCFCTSVTRALNTYTFKNVYLSFLSFVWFLQFLSNFLWLQEAKSQLTHFRTENRVNRAIFVVF